jgi:uncharacterized protein (DUF697 family)
MPLGESLALAGGIIGATAVTFIAVSYAEVKKKIDLQIAAGEDPYELRQTRDKPPQKKQKAKKKK